MKNINSVVDNDIRTIMEETLVRAQFAKSEMCREEAMTDSPPILLIGVESDETNPAHEDCLEYQKENGLSKPYHIALVPLIHRDDIYDSYEDVIRALPIRKFEFLLLAVEGYGKFGDSEIPQDYERGQMEEDYRNNPFSDVREAIVLTAVDWEATGAWNVISTYRYDDFGVPQYDEPMCSVEEISPEETDNLGRIVGTLVGTCRYMKLAITTVAYNDLLQRAPKKGDKS